MEKDAGMKKGTALMLQRLVTRLGNKSRVAKIDFIGEKKTQSKKKDLTEMKILGGVDPKTLNMTPKELVEYKRK